MTKSEQMEIYPEAGENQDNHTGNDMYDANPEGEAQQEDGSCSRRRWKGDEKKGGTRLKRSTRRKVEQTQDHSECKVE